MPDSGFTDKSGTLHADNVSLTKLAEAYGTPAYIYSARRIRSNIRRLQEAFRQTLPAGNQPLIAFACKACGNIGILNLLAAQDAGADVVSGGELRRALAAGIPANKIVFSGVGKTAGEISLALESGILQLNIESKPEAELIADIAVHRGKKAPVAFRFNPDVAADTHEKISTGRRENKFGLTESALKPLYEWASRQPSLSLQGLSLHIGSQITMLEPFGKAFEKLAALTRDLKSQNLPVPCLDLGGGLGIAYGRERAPSLDRYAAMIRDLIAPLDTALIVEPGRLLTGDAGVLLAKVLYVKETGTRRIVILDAGMNDFVRPAMYEAFHPIRPVARAGGAETLCDVTGPVCETGDTFTRDCLLPPLSGGDLVAIMAAGAYGFSMASNYNTRPLPPEILVDGARHTLIRQRQGIQDILEGEHIPDWPDDT